MQQHEEEEDGHDRVAVARRSHEYPWGLIGGYGLITLMDEEESAWIRGLGNLAGSTACELVVAWIMIDP
jgi:hypothetical protein